MLTSFKLTTNSTTPRYSFSVLTLMSSSSDSSIASEISTSPTITHKRNSGRKKFRETRHPIYRGVRQRNGGKWVCEMRLNSSNSQSRLWLGTHITPEMAARAHDVAALALKGKSAQLNFADSSWLLPLPKSSARRDIQSTALAAAHAYLPKAKSSSPSSSSTYSLEALLNTPLESSATLFFDEEAMFNMPCLLVDMAEGMLLTPPFMQQRESDWEDSCLDFEMDSLWSL